MHRFADRFGFSKGFYIFTKAHGLVVIASCTNQPISRWTCHTVRPFKRGFFLHTNSVDNTHTRKPFHVRTSFFFVVVGWRERLKSAFKKMVIQGLRIPLFCASKIIKGNSYWRDFIYVYRCYNRLVLASGQLTV